MSAERLQGRGAREGNVFPVIRKFPIETKNGLYCVWIRQTELPGSPLVAVWIDPHMSCFGGGPSKAEPLLAVNNTGEGVADMPPPPPVKLGRQKWQTAVRGLAAVLVWMLAALVAQGQTSGRTTGVVRD